MATYRTNRDDRIGPQRGPCQKINRPPGPRDATRVFIKFFIKFSIKFFIKFARRVAIILVTALSRCVRRERSPRLVQVAIPRRFKLISTFFAQIRFLFRSLGFRVQRGPRRYSNYIAPSSFRRESPSSVQTAGNWNNQVRIVARAINQPAKVRQINRVQVYQKYIV